MIRQYMDKAMRRAHYEIIDDDEPFYGEIDGFKGLWATGNTLEECRDNLEETLEDWLLFSIAKGLPIPEVEGASIEVPEIIQAA